MQRKTKYQPLADYLSATGKDIVELTFSQIENILGFSLSPSARRHRANWSNNEIEALSWGWRNAGYESFDVNLQAEVAHFKKVGIVVPKIHNAKISQLKEIKITKSTKIAINDAKDEILLDVPDNIKTLEYDEYYLVKLNKKNSELVESELAIDPGYKQIGRAAFERRIVQNNDYSEDAYYEIINRIATENSTRTSKQTMQFLARYLSNPRTNFLAKLEEGNPQLVDDLLNYLVENGERRDKSLVSKICRYLNEWIYHNDAFTINDSVVRKVLPYYLAYYRIDKKLWYGVNFDELTNVKFFELFEKVRENVPDLNRHELDHLIWYSYKNDNIRLSIASSLALYLE